MKFHQLLVLPIAAMAIVSCSSITTESSTSASIEQGVPGGELVETTQLNATVTAIDGAKRKLTLVTAKNETFSVIAGPEVVNFAQIRVGDHLKASVIQTSVIRMAKPGEKIKDISSATVDLAPLGAKPGVSTTETHQGTATVTAINLKRHKATLLFGDGTTKEFDVRKDVDLTQRKVGEKVVIRTTETIATQIEKP